MLKTETHLTAVPAFAAGASRAVAAYAGVAVTQACSAPMTAVDGTTVSIAGFGSALVRALDVTATPGSPPREAPV